MIFISHKQIDSGKATELHGFLKSRGVDSYLDVLDQGTKAAPDITKHIMGNLNKCTHLIVVFTPNTQGSMWVPFELGAAYVGGKGIGTMLFENPTTPEYLDTFPRMKTSQHLDEFVTLYKSNQSLQKSRSTVVLNESQRISEADSFIRNLKTKLGQ